MAEESASRDWQSIAEGKRAKLLASIPEIWTIPKDIFPPESQSDVTTFPETSGFFTEMELAVTGAQIPELLGKIHDGTWSSEVERR